jgi:hypothetical protein
MTYAPRSIKAGIATFKLKSVRLNDVNAAWLRDARGATARLPLGSVRAAHRRMVRIPLSSVRWSSAGRHQRIRLVVSTDSAPAVAPPPLSGSWRGFANPGKLPPAVWRPYSDGAAWNRGTSGATVHRNSAAMVAYLRRTSGGQMQSIAVPDDTGSAPVYWADSDDPVYTVRCRKWVSSCEVHGIKVRIPERARPTADYDRHLVSVQPDGKEVDLWEADVPSGSGGVLYASHGGTTRITGDSTGSDAVAAGIGAMAGQFRSTSWRADTIRHALQLVIDRDNGSYVYPARKTGTSDPSASPVPMGQWFKLNVSDADLAAEPPWRRALYRAMRDYGLFVVDTGARPIGIEHENPRTRRGRGCAGRRGSTSGSTRPGR